MNHSSELLDKTREFVEDSFEYYFTNKNGIYQNEYYSRIIITK